jgi:hypothetical protein
MKKTVLVLVSLLAWSSGCVIVGIFVGDRINNAGTITYGPTTSVLHERTVAAVATKSKLRLPVELRSGEWCRIGALDGLNALSACDDDDVRKAAEKVLDHMTMAPLSLQAVNKVALPVALRRLMAKNDGKADTARRLLFTLGSIDE